MSRVVIFSMTLVMNKFTNMFTSIVMDDWNLDGIHTGYWHKVPWTLHPNKLCTEIFVMDDWRLDENALCEWRFLQPISICLGMAFGLSQFHGHGSWLVCEVALSGVSYSLHFKIKVTFGHKLRHEIKVTCGEISLKLHQTNWNVARINVNAVVDELPSQIIDYTCLTIDIWTYSTTSTHINTILCASTPSAQSGGLPVKLTPKVVHFIRDTRSLPESA